VPCALGRDDPADAVREAGQVEVGLSRDVRDGVPAAQVEFGHRDAGAVAHRGHEADQLARGGLVRGQVREL
jgi:hypothetical protein